ncbi:hypothetical protein [Paenibacillus sp. GCM10012306]|uniref:hypothetical protein n=1 Tax=Paenibacillus sp. GCM10012306 TaxID=3317342 RepID=UPI00361733F7
MSRVGRKLTMVTIWAGIGILIGMQFGGGETRISDVLPGWNDGTQTAKSVPAVAGNGGVRQKPAPSAGAPQTYVYVPMAVDPATGAYMPLPVRTETGAAGQTPDNQPQQETEDYSTTLTPEQILVPEGQKPTVDVLADKTAGLLQEASQKGIRWVVSLFSSAE